LVGLKETRLSIQEEGGETLSLLREIGEIYEQRLGQKEMAFLAACRAYREDFNDAAVAKWMDRLALATDSVEELIAVYDDALEHLQDETRIIETHLRIAELAWSQLEDADAAELHLKRVLEHQADHEQALERLSALYIELSRWTEVVALHERKFDMVSEVSDKHAILRRIAALFENNIDDVDGAVAAYKRMLDLEPANLHVVREFGEMLERCGRWQTLIGILAKEEDLVETPAEKVKVRFRVAEVWEQEINEPKHAVEIHLSILQENPEYLPSLKALERLHTNLG
jgi:tetratricopeptide (TPR) repeat protein